jgi:hypothetical protein
MKHMPARRRRGIRPEASRLISYVPDQRNSVIFVKYYCKSSILGWLAMQKLKLPSYSFRIEEKNGKQLIFDDLRRKWLTLTPEEWVRQHFIQFLIMEKMFPASLMAIEKKVMINGLSQRFDLLVYDRKGNPLMIAEFKSPDIPIDQTTFDQASRYNSVLTAPYFLISNGMVHFVCKLDFKNRTTHYLGVIPTYAELIQS